MQRQRWCARLRPFSRSAVAVGTEAGAAAFTAEPAVADFMAVVAAGTTRAAEDSIQVLAIMVAGAVGTAELDVRIALAAGHMEDPAGTAAMRAVGTDIVAGDTVVARMAAEGWQDAARRMLRERTGGLAVRRRGLESPMVAGIRSVAPEARQQGLAHADWA